MSFCNKMNYGNEVIDINKNTLIAQNEDLAEEGFRVIAIADGIIENFE